MPQKIGISQFRRAQRSRETHQAPRLWTHDGDGRCSALAMFELLPSNSNTHLVLENVKTHPARSQVCPQSPGPRPPLVRPAPGPTYARCENTRTDCGQAASRRLRADTHTHHSRVPSSAGAPPPQTATLTWPDGLRGSSTLRRPIRGSSTLRRPSSWRSCRAACSHRS